MAIKRRFKVTYKDSGTLEKEYYNDKDKAFMYADFLGKQGFRSISVFVYLNSEWVKLKPTYFLKYVSFFELSSIYVWSEWLLGSILRNDPPSKLYKRYNRKYNEIDF